MTEATLAKALFDKQIKDGSSIRAVQDVLRNPPAEWGVTEREEYTRLVLAHILGKLA
jgi:hypothetical protein